MLSCLYIKGGSDFAVNWSVVAFICLFSLCCLYLAELGSDMKGLGLETLGKSGGLLYLENTLRFRCQVCLPPRLWIWGCVTEGTSTLSSHVLLQPSSLWQTEPWKAYKALPVSAFP